MTQGHTALVVKPWLKQRSDPRSSLLLLPMRNEACQQKASIWPLEQDRTARQEGLKGMMKLNYVYYPLFLSIAEHFPDQDLISRLGGLPPPTPPCWIWSYSGSMSAPRRKATSGVQEYFRDTKGVVPDHGNKVSHNLYADGGFWLQFVNSKQTRGTICEV